MDDRSPTRVELLDSTRSLEAGDLAWLEERLKRALGLLGAAGEVRVRFVSDAAIAEAHARHCSIPTTTDVLTFDERLDHADPTLDADILACVDEARRQAQSRGHDLRSELLLYALHGVLHCFGHDDLDEDARARMHAREDEILGAIGVGPVYAREPRS